MSGCFIVHRLSLQLLLLFPLVLCVCEPEREGVHFIYLFHLEIVMITLKRWWLYCWGLWETVSARSSGLRQHGSWRISERVCQLNIGRRSAECHWDSLAFDFVCSQSLEHLRREIIMALHIWRLSFLLQFFTNAFFYHMLRHFLCDQELSDLDKKTTAYLNFSIFLKNAHH